MISDSLVKVIVLWTNIHRYIAVYYHDTVRLIVSNRMFWDVIAHRYNIFYATNGRDKHFIVYYNIILLIYITNTILLTISIISYHIRQINSASMYYIYIRQKCDWRPLSTVKLNNILYARFFFRDVCGFRSVRFGFFWCGCRLYFDGFESSYTPSPLNRGLQVSYYDKGTFVPECWGGSIVGICIYPERSVYYCITIWMRFNVIYYKTR